MNFINWPRVFPLFILAFVAGATPSVVTNALDLKFAHDFPESQAQRKNLQKNEAVKLELSVYHSKYDGRITRWGRTYNHWGDMTCASNNPAHKNKVLRVTYGKLTATLFCNDTGGDKRLGYSRLDISGKAMKFFAPKWNGKDKGAPLLKGASVEVVE